MLGDIIKSLVEPLRLTPREVDVIRALSQGHGTTRDLSRHLGISESTVQNHIDHISMKTGLAGKTEILVHLIQRALELLDNARFFLVTPHILVMEDQVEIADAISQSLQNRGCHVSTVYEVETSTLNHVKNVRPDLVICDLHLGHTNGVQFLRELRLQTERSPSMIVISGQSMPETSLAPFVSAWVPKPLDVAQLFETTIKTLIIRSCLNDREQRLKVDWPAHVNKKNPSKVHFVSPYGITLFSETFFQPDDVLDIALHPIGAQTIQVRCKVSWTSTIDAAWWIGLHFLTISDVDRNWITEYIHTQNILRFLPWSDQREVEGVFDHVPRSLR
jgi:DNA-binding NarL/FixJ family response regulator